MTDSEAALGATKTFLAARGVELVQSAPGTHAPLVERRIRVVKERCRATLGHLPYVLPIRFYPFLIEYVVSSLNSVPDSLTTDNVSARERLTGRKLYFNSAFRAPFWFLCACVLFQQAGRQ